MPERSGRPSTGTRIVEVTVRWHFHFRRVQSARREDRQRSSLGIQRPKQVGRMYRCVICGGASASAGGGGRRLPRHRPEVRALAVLRARRFVRRLRIQRPEVPAGERRMIGRDEPRAKQGARRVAERVGKVAGKGALELPYDPACGRYFEEPSGRAVADEHVPTRLGRGGRRARDVGHVVCTSNRPTHQRQERLMLDRASTVRGS